MKKFRKICCLIVLLAASAPGALSSEIEYKPTGKAAADLTCSLSVQRVAERDISRGYVNLQGGNVQIYVPQTEYLNQSVVLSGKVLKTSVTISGHRADISGIMYFDGGEWLASIDDPSAVDFAFFEKGFARGHIAHVNDDSVVFDKFGHRQEFKLDDIKELRSPRAYTFNISATADAIPSQNAAFKAEANEISLKETIPLRSLSPLSVNPHKKDDDDLDLDLSGDDSDLPKNWPALSPFPRLSSPAIQRYSGGAVDP